MSTSLSLKCIVNLVEYNINDIPFIPENQTNLPSQIWNANWLIGLDNLRIIKRMVFSHLNLHGPFQWWLSHFKTAFFMPVKIKFKILNCRHESWKRPLQSIYHHVAMSLRRCWTLSFMMIFHFAVHLRYRIVEAAISASNLFCHFVLI
jgi:hypothetical protein